MNLGGDTVGVVVVATDPDSGTSIEICNLLRYCDKCRRWGRRGSVHLCGENWSDHLGPLLAELARERKGLSRGKVSR